MTMLKALAFLLCACVCLCVLVSCIVGPGQVSFRGRGTLIHLGEEEPSPIGKSLVPLNFRQ